MKTLNRIPTRLPAEPVFIRETKGHYAIWTGRSWFGSISQTFGRSWEPQCWMLTTPGSPCEVFRTLDGAKQEAEHRANRAEGRA